MIRETFTFLVLMSLMTGSIQFAAAQESQATGDPYFAAVQYVLTEQERFPDLPQRGRLVVDVRASPEGEALGLNANASAARLAASLDARPGNLDAHMSCPSRAPTPEEVASGDWGCRLKGNTEMVLSVGEPSVENDTLYVWVVVHQEVKDREAKRVVGQGYEVALTRQEGEAWIPVGIRSRSAT